MAKIKYQCKKEDCRYEFYGDEYTTNCTNCDSERIEPIKDKKDRFVCLNFFRMYKAISLGLLALLLAVLLLVLFWGDICPIIGICSQDSNEAYTLSPLPQSPDANYVEFTLTTSAGELTPIEEYESLIKSIEVINSGGRKLMFEKNRIFLCPEDSGVFYVKAETWSEKIVIKSQGSFECSMRGIEPDARGGCSGGEQAMQEKIVVEALGNCEFAVKYLDPTKKVLISVNGQSGDFKDQSLWKMEKSADQRYDVWVYIQGSDIQKYPPVPYLRNGEQIKPICCDSCEDPCKTKDAKKIAEINGEILKRANAFMSNPDRGNKNAFSDYLNDKLPEIRRKIFVEGKAKSLSEFLVFVESEFNNSPSRQFFVKGVSLCDGKIEVTERKGL